MLILTNLVKFQPKWHGPSSYPTAHVPVMFSACSKDMLYGNSPNQASIPRNCSWPACFLQMSPPWNILSFPCSVPYLSQDRLGNTKCKTEATSLFHVHPCSIWLARESYHAQIILHAPGSSGAKHEDVSCKATTCLYSFCGPRCHASYHTIFTFYKPT